MVDFDKLFSADDVIPVDKDGNEVTRVGEFCFAPGPIPLSEFDIGGVLYHANYFHLYERAREAMLDELGFAYPKLVADGMHLAIVNSEQRFHKPIYYGMEVEVGLRCHELKSASLTFTYAIYQENAIIHTAITRHAFVAKNSSGEMHPIRLPKALVQAMGARFTS